jgi:hypothetical protein
LKIVLILLFSFSVFASVFDSEFDGYSSKVMMNQTRDALLSYSFIKKRTKRITKDIERKVLGEYTEKLFLIAPFLLGQVEFNSNDVRFYVNARKEKGGVEYVYNF